MDVGICEDMVAAGLQRVRALPGVSLCYHGGCLKPHVQSLRLKHVFVRLAGQDVKW